LVPLNSPKLAHDRLIQVKAFESSIIQFKRSCGALKTKAERFAMSNRRSAVATLMLTFLLSASAGAQQINGIPGSPSATTAIDGKQLPSPDPKFGGVIKDDALQSKPWWAPRVVPLKSAPNVLLIITDDAGFGCRAPSAG
jgi:hypothetical protein